MGLMELIRYTEGLARGSSFRPLDPARKQANSGPSNCYAKVEIILLGAKTKCAFRLTYCTT